MQVKQSRRSLTRRFGAVVHFILFLLVCSFAGPIASCSSTETESSIPAQEEEDSTSDPAIDAQDNLIRRQPAIPVDTEISHRTGQSRISLQDASLFAFVFAEGRSAPQRC